MKWTAMVAIMFLLAAAAGVVTSLPARAEEAGPIDQAFEKANRWLKENNLKPSTPFDALAGDYILVIGRGVPKADVTHPGQRKLTAERAAEIDGYRKLSEFLDGVALVGDSRIEDLGLKYDKVRVAVSGFARGVQVAFKEYNEKDEIALVIMKVGKGGPQGYGNLIFRKFLGDPDVRNEIEKDAGNAYKPAVPPSASENKYDAVVFDATGVSFRPAVVNRVFTPKGEVLYDPARVNPEILSERGAGAYTNSVEKGKEILAKMGAKNPLVVKAVQSRNASDIVVSEEDAIKIYTANLKEGFLGGARVAFVMK